MTDADLVAKRLAVIETAVHELRTMAIPDRVGVDLRETRFVERTLQVALQAMLDTASHIVSDERLGEPRTNRELITLLVGANWVPSSLSDVLVRMVGFRNILVHNYDTVNTDIVRDILTRHLDDLLAFTAAVRQRLGPPS